MATRAGLHIMDSGVDDWGALDAWLDKLGSTAHLVLNNVALAGHLSRQLNATIISRKMHPQENGYWMWASPESVVNYVGNEYDVINQVLNEPGDYDAGMVGWMCDVVVAGTRLGQRIGIPAYATGNPYQDHIRAGKYDRLLRTLSGTKHALILHEYFTTNYGGVFVPGIPWWVGRYNFYLDRCKAMGITPPQMFITESGRDIGGAKGRNGDGWRNAKHPNGTNWAEQEYLRYYETQLNQYPSSIPLVIFCYGRGWSSGAFPEGEWHSFDVQQSNVILDGIVRYNQAVQIVEKPPMAPVPLPAGTPVIQGKLAQPLGPLNIRSAPAVAAGNIVGNISKDGAIVSYAEPISYPDWYWVRTATAEGWVSKQKSAATPVQFQPVLVIPPPVTNDSLTPEELNDLADRFLAISVLEHEISDIYRKAAARGTTPP